jgi:hypothetical protein
MLILWCFQFAVDSFFKMEDTRKPSGKHASPKLVRSASASPGAMSWPYRSE